MDSIIITTQEIDDEKQAFERDGVTLATETIIDILKNKKEQEMWTEDGSLMKDKNGD
jgi:hypothetical protein